MVYTRVNGMRATTTMTQAAEPRRKPAGDTRAQILRAAERVLEKNDLADARVEDILTEAAVSRRTFYQYFSNKSDVAAGIMESAVAGMLGQAAGLRDLQVPVAEKIATTVNLYLELWRDSGRVMQSIVRESQRTGSPLSEARTQAIEAFARFVCSALAGEGIRVSRSRARFAIVGTEAMMMRAAQCGDLGNRNLRVEVVRAVQALLLEKT